MAVRKLSMTKKTLKNTSTRIRVDFFLTTKIANLSRAQIQNFITDGLIKVNSKVCKKNSQILEIGDKVEIQIPEAEKIQANKELKLEIIFEDRDFLAINKPAGLLVHPTDTEKQNTIVNILMHEYPKINFGEKDREGIVHRLDQDTSGVLVIPKNLKTYKELQELFQEHQIHKTYIAVVLGKPKMEEFEISTRQKRSSSNPTKNIVVHTKEGKAAETKIKLLATSKLKNQIISVLELRPKTGRMHQLRLQLAYLNLPILGDSKYGNKPSLNFSKKLEISRQLLHAYKIEFNLNTKQYKITAQMPNDIKKFL